MPNQARSSHRVLRTTVLAGGGHDTVNREWRRPFQGEEEYAKYMKSIRQRYQKYVRNIWGHNGWRDNRTVAAHSAVEHDGLISNVHDEQHTEQQLAPATSTQYPLNYRPAKKKVQPKKVNSVNKRKTNQTLKATANAHLYGQNTYKTLNSQRFGQSTSTRPQKKTNLDIMAQLNAQMVRKKRNTENGGSDAQGERTGKLGGGRKNGRRNLNVTAVVATVASVAQGGADDVEAGETTADGQKRGKPKSPCDVSIPVKIV